MTNVPKHDLIHEFPEFKDKIHQMKASSAHFAKLFDAYHKVQHEVHAIEGNDGNTSDEYLEGRKKERLHLKDQLYQMLIAK